MKKALALMILLMDGSLLAHAAAVQSAAPEIPITQSAKDQPTTDNTDSESVGAGSGDDVDTTDEASPVNDNDPEADVGTQ